MKRFAALVFVCAVAAAGCSSKDDIPFDSATQNFHGSGCFGGMDLALDVATGLEAEREYRGPHEPGTDPVARIPDISESALCELGVAFVVMIDGTEWEVELEFENFVSGQFATGEYTVIAIDQTPGPNETSIEFQMIAAGAEFEKTAISGTVDLRVYNNTGTHAENDAIVEGGSVGGVFELEFGPNENIEGSFHVDFGANDILGKDC